MTHPRFIPLGRAAARLGVPRCWLYNEAKTGGIPSLFVGRRWLVDPDRLEEILVERAEAERAQASPAENDDGEGGGR